MFHRLEENPWSFTIFIPRYPLAHGWATSKLPNLAQTELRSKPQESSGESGTPSLAEEHREYMSVVQIEECSPIVTNIIQ